MYLLFWRKKGEERGREQRSARLQTRVYSLSRTSPLSLGLLQCLVKCTHKSQNVYYQTSCETGEAARPVSQTNTAQRHMQMRILRYAQDLGETTEFLLQECRIEISRSQRAPRGHITWVTYGFYTKEQGRHIY